jgi:signal transduction histidine kinase
MTSLPTTTSSHRETGRIDNARRIEELGQIIAAYNEVTDKLQASHDQLTRTVQSLRQELGEKSRLLERKNRLAALGEMAAGMAHEIRNPLGGIQLYASLLAQDVADRPDALQRVNKISGGVKRLESLVGQVLQFTREITAAPAPIDLADVVEQAVEYAAQAIARHGIECRVRGPRPMPASADPGLLGQAVLSRLLYAAEAIGEAARDERQAPVGDLVGSALRTVCCRVGESVRNTHPIESQENTVVFSPSPGTPGEGRGGGRTLNRATEAPSLALPRSTGGGDKCRIIVTYGPPPAGSAARQFHLTVQDTGSGVPPAVMDRIFNPFFTTRDNGTGLGLSIVHRIVEAHDGTIHVTNPPDGGAKFEIRV